MFHITSKYFCIFNNAPSASLVAHITRDFLTCYFCLYYSSMIYHIKRSCPSCPRVVQYLFNCPQDLSVLFNFYGLHLPFYTIELSREIKYLAQLFRSIELKRKTKSILQVEDKRVYCKVKVKLRSESLKKMNSQLKQTEEKEC